jgi:hypothetical protein
MNDDTTTSGTWKIRVIATRTWSSTGEGETVETRKIGHVLNIRDHSVERDLKVVRSGRECESGSNGNN